MIHIKLHDRRDIPSGEEMDRSWVGYDPRRTTDELFHQNRGKWRFGPRAKQESYAAFSYTGDHEIKFVARIDGLEKIEGTNKQAIIGEVLPDDHPLYRRWVGEQAPDGFRNPVTYHPDEPGGSPAGLRCACGCGVNVAVGRSFVPGHDQRAVHERIKKEWGGALRFIQWFDREFPDSVPTEATDADAPIAEARV